MSSLALLTVVIVFLLVFLRSELGLYLVILSMLFSPEVSAGGGLAEHRSLVFRAEDFLLLIIAVSWFAKTAVNKELGLITKTPLNGPIRMYIVVTFLATLVGYLLGTVRSAAGFLYILKYVEYFFVYYMVVNNLSDRAQARRLVIVAFVTAAVVSLIGMSQIPSGQRVSAPFEGEVGEPNTFGGYLLLLMSISLGVALETTRAHVRACMLALTGMMFFPFLFTLSRASYVGLIPAIGVLAFLSARRRVMIALLAIALVGSPVLLSLTPAPVVKRVVFTFKPEERHPTTRIGGVAFDPSTSARFLSFKDALNGWISRPILGYGVTGFGFMDAQYARTLVETGLIGLAAFLWLLVSIFRTARDSFRSLVDPEDRGLALGFLAGTAGLAAHAIGSNTFIIVRIMEPFWLFTGIVVMLPRFQESAVPAAIGPRARGIHFRGGLPRGAPVS
jgi:O-antigen ligase